MQTHIIWVQSSYEKVGLVWFQSDYEYVIEVIVLFTFYSAIQLVFKPSFVQENTRKMKTSCLFALWWGELLLSICSAPLLLSMFFGFFCSLKRKLQEAQ